MFSQYFLFRTWYDLFGTVIPNRMELPHPPPPTNQPKKNQTQPTLRCPFFQPFSYLVTIFTNKEHCFCSLFWSNILMMTLAQSVKDLYTAIFVYKRYLNYLSFFIHVFYMSKLVTSQNISKIRQQRHVLP